jgi:hypothetical protein
VALDMLPAICARIAHQGDGMQAPTLVAYQVWMQKAHIKGYGTSC